MPQHPGRRWPTGEARGSPRPARRRERLEVAGLGELAERGRRSSPDHVGDGRRQPELLGDLGDGLGAAVGVEAAGVGHHLDAAVEAGAHDLLHLGDEGAGVAAAGPLGPGAGEDQHGELGQPVAGEHVDGPALDHLGGAPRAGRRRSPSSWRCGSAAVVIGSQPSVVEQHEEVAVVDLVAGGHPDLGDRGRAGRGDLVLHLHGLDHHEQLAVVDVVAGRDVDDEHRAGERRHGPPPAAVASWSAKRGRRRHDVHPAAPDTWRTSPVDRTRRRWRTPSISMDTRSPSILRADTVDGPIVGAERPVVGRHRPGADVELVTVLDGAHLDRHLDVALVDPDGAVAVGPQVAPARRREWRRPDRCSARCVRGRSLQLRAGRGGRRPRSAGWPGRRGERRGRRWGCRRRGSRARPRIARDSRRRS